jgi:hypothetical protein
MDTPKKLKRRIVAKIESFALNGDVMTKPDHFKYFIQNCPV